jgi:hypothetical protein
MTPELNPETTRKLLDGTHGEELKGFLTAHIRALDRVSDIKLTDPTEISLEVLGRQRAAQTLALILKPLLEYKEPGDPATEQEGSLYHSHLESN